MDNEREKLIVRTSALGIIVNIAIAIVKIAIGFFTSSFAIMTEGLNNASDAVTSILTIVGTKLSNKHPDENHPFGYGRVEYLTGIAVSLIIMYAGVESFKESFIAIFRPVENGTTIMAAIIILSSGIIKFFLGMHTINVGKKTGSNALIGVGEECRNDSYISLITIVSILIYVFTKFSIDAYVGVLFSILIIKAGFGTLMESVSDILGRKGEEELAKKIYKIVRANPLVIGAADLMLHNYGPDRYSGSVNIEIDHNKTIGEIYEVIHALQLKIMHELNVVMVFGMYAVDNDHEDVKEMRKYIVDYILKNKDITSVHALYYNKNEHMIYCDFIVKYSLKDWDALRDDFTKYMKAKYPDENLELTIETDFV